MKTNATDRDNSIVRRGCTFIRKQKVWCCAQQQQPRSSVKYEYGCGWNEGAAAAAGTLRNQFCVYAAASSHAKVGKGFTRYVKTKKKFNASSWVKHIGFAETAIYDVRIWQQRRVFFLIFHVWESSAHSVNDYNSSLYRQQFFFYNLDVV